MPGSQLLLLAVSAAVLLVPAALSLLAVERRRHLAALEGTTRRVRMVVAATGAGLGALVISALAGAGPVSSVVTAVVVAAALLCWTPLTRSWQVRGVVAWALAVVAAVAALGWLLYEILTEMSGGEMFAPLVGWGLLVAVLLGLRRWLWGVVGARARIAAAPAGSGGPAGVGGPAGAGGAGRTSGAGGPSKAWPGPEHSGGVPGALPATVALVAAGVVAVAVVTDGSGLVRWVTPPEAASIGTSEGPDRAVSSETPTPTTQTPTPTSAAPTSSASGPTTSPPATVAPTSTGAPPTRRPTLSPEAAPTRRVPTGVPAGVAPDDVPGGTGQLRGDGGPDGHEDGPGAQGMRGGRSPSPGTWPLGPVDGHRGPH